VPLATAVGLLLVNDAILYISYNCTLSRIIIFIKMGSKKSTLFKRAFLILVLN